MKQVVSSASDAVPSMFSEEVLVSEKIAKTCRDTKPGTSECEILPKSIFEHVQQDGLDCERS